MDIIATAYTLDELNNIKDYVDGIMIEHNYLSNPYIHNVDTHSLITKVNELNLIAILKVNRMVHPFEIEKVRTLLMEFKEYDVLFYITDLGVFNILKELSLLNRVIYNPNTMICNSLDANIYLDYGLDSIGLSLEITSKDVKTISDKCQNKIFYHIFGYYLMFHSKRNLISLYSEKINKNFSKDNLLLEEATRNDLYPVIENEQGTLIYRSYILSLIKEIKNLNLKYGYFEHFKIDNETYLEVLKIYNEYLRNKIDLTLAIQKLNILNLDYKDGFTYKDSVYQKEEF